MNSVTARPDIGHRPQGRRVKFVKVNLAARDELRERLWTYREKATVEFAYSVASWVVDLLAEADYRTGAVPHTDASLARLAGLSRSTIARRCDLLALAGVLEGSAGERVFRAEAWRWLTDGAAAPVDPVWTWLCASADADHRAAPVDHRSRSVDHSAGGVDHKSATTPPTCGNDLLDLQDCEDQQTGGGSVLGVLNSLVSGCAKNKSVAYQVERLRGLGYQDAEIVAHVEPIAQAAKTPGLVVTTLQAVVCAPPRVERLGRQERERARAAAPDCKHGTPQGTYDGRGVHPPGWRQCVECSSPGSRRRSA